MIISPEEFLKRSKHLGFTSHMFKSVMVEATVDTDKLHQTINEGKNFYFSYDSRCAHLKFYVSTDSEADNMEEETSTHAFKLLKLIAE